MSWSCGGGHIYPKCFTQDALIFTFALPFRFLFFSAAFLDQLVCFLFKSCIQLENSFPFFSSHIFQMRFFQWSLLSKQIPGNLFGPMRRLRNSPLMDFYAFSLFHLLHKNERKINGCTSYRDKIFCNFESFYSVFWRFQEHASFTKNLTVCETLLLSFFFRQRHSTISGGTRALLSLEWLLRWYSCGPSTRQGAGETISSLRAKLFFWDSLENQQKIIGFHTSVFYILNLSTITNWAHFRPKFFETNT